MAGRWHVILSRAALFLEKARLFPNTKFIVGLDTALRVLDKKYYSNSEKQAENGRISKHFLHNFDSFIGNQTLGLQFYRSWSPC